MSSSTCLFFGILLISVLGLASVETSAGEKPFKDPKVYILSIGISKYKDAGVSNLRGPIRDTQLVNEIMRRSFSDIAEATLLLDNYATKDSILRALETFAAASTPDDVVIFSFSGHGSLIQSDSGLVGTLIPFDSDAYGTNDLSSAEILGAIRRIRAGKKVVLLDAANMLNDPKAALATFTESDPKKARLVNDDFVIVGVKGFAFESQIEDNELEVNGTYGYLSYWFASAMTGRADFDGNGTISSLELKEYFTSILARPLPERGAEGCALWNNRHDCVEATDEFRRTYERTLRVKGVRAEFRAMDVQVLVSKSFDMVRLKNTRPEERQSAQGPAPPMPVREGIAEKPARMTRAQVYMSNRPDRNATRNGNDYALLFANDKYDNDQWSTLRNPRNDVRDIAKELKEKYGFKGVDIRENLTTLEIYDTIEAYQHRTFEKPDDQLFIFFAGHGVTDVISDRVRSGFYVGRDSPYPFTRKNSGEFVQLDRLLTAIDLIPVNYSMTVFDACFAGQIWKPSVQLISETAVLEPYTVFQDALDEIPRSIGKMAHGPMSIADLIDQDVSRSAYAKRKMKSKSRVIMTSGDRPVDDAFEEEDGSLSRNSPFADAFLRALRTGGGEDGVLITAEIIPFIDKLNVEPQRGRLSGSDGDFVFVRPEEKQANSGR